MKAMVQVLTSAVLCLAITAVAGAQDSAQVRAHIDAARKLAGAEGASAATFFCSTEEQVAAMKILPSATEGDVEGQRAEPMKVFDNLLNHPIMDGLFEKLAMVRTRKPGGPHPLVIGEASYQRFVSVMAECTRAQLARKN